MDEGRLRDLARQAESITVGVSVEVRAALAAEVFRMLASDSLLSANTPSTTSPVRQALLSAPLVQTLAEYLAGFRDLSHPTRLVAIAAFRLRMVGTDGLTTDDFLSAYTEVRTPRPQNISANISRCIRRGWLVQGAQQDGQRTWRATQRGLSMLNALNRDEED